MKVDWLIVGAGFTGAVLAERIASELGQRVLIVDRRPHVAGNAYDEYDENGVLVHRYGAHLFHTNDRRIWEYLSRFTEWDYYQHRVVAEIDGQRVPIPFNLNSLYQLFSPRQAAKLEDLLLAEFGHGEKVPILRLRESASADLKRIADFVYEKVFRGYTEKQWGLTPEELGPSVTARVPIHISRDDRYFQDRYQGMPRGGYSRMFARMLFHPRIKVLLNTDYREIIGDIHFNRMIYTGPLDAYFDFIHGPLPYRSLRFECRHERSDSYQNVAVVNYPNEHAFTRILEWKHMTGQRTEGTTITLEYPQPHVAGQNEPYYPVPRDENQESVNRYRTEAERLHSTVLFAGRLADYRYYNMDQAVGRALSLFEKEITEHNIMANCVMRVECS